MVQHEKSIVRKEMLGRRNAMSEELRAAASAAILDSLFREEHFRQAKAVALYHSIGSEVQTREIIARAVAEEKEVLLPIVASDHHLVLHKFHSFERMRKGRFGIPEPEPDAEWLDPEHETGTIHAEDPQVVVLPGVAFGLCMHRLGYGRGYYDRLLARLPSYRIGICFDIQVVEKLPRHEDDQRMNKIITEKRVIV